jgi:hypothetical protein
MMKEEMVKGEEEWWSAIAVFYQVRPVLDRTECSTSAVREGGRNSLPWRSSTSGM